MLLVILIGCDGSDGIHAARARARGFLDDHPRGSAIVQVGEGGSHVRGVVGGAWAGADLREHLAPCGADVDADFDAELILEPGEPVDPDVRMSGSATCVEAHLATFPFEEPSRRGERDVLLVRWRPAEVVEPYAWDDRAERVDPAPRGLWSQSPPYWRVSDVAPLWGPGFDVKHGRLLLPPVQGARVEEGPLADADTWARQLTCPAEELDLVRVALGFRHGELDVLETLPANDCVRAKVRESRRWMRDQSLGATVLRDPAHALVVLDVPVGSW